MTITRYLLTIMMFRTHLTFILLRSTKDSFLKNISTFFIRKSNHALKLQKKSTKKIGLEEHKVEEKDDRTFVFLVNYSFNVTFNTER